MKRINLVIVLSAVLAFSSCRDQNASGNQEENMNQTQNDTVALDNQMDNQEEEQQTVTVDLASKSGSNVTGTATFTEENGEVTMEATIMGLSEGTHAIHLHENADCSAEDGSSAGGHWNPTFEDHGQWGDEEGFHRGDIGNFEVNAEGVGTVTFTTDLWCIGCGDEEKDILGKAVIVHEGVDDYTSQPSGAAGTRVACAGIIQ